MSGRHADHSPLLPGRRADVIELHYFGGLTYPEIAGALGISESTVHEDLRGARVWLLQQLGGAAAAT